MQSVQRQFGRFMKRSADDSQVAILLKDYDQTDKLLGKIVEDTRTWRDAWSSILLHQERMLVEFDSIYPPIIGSSDSTAASKATPTPEATLARTQKLREEYEVLRKELAEDLNAVDQRMIKPASDAKEHLTPLKKTIKKREDRKLDYERYQSRVDSYTKKTKRSERDNVALAKAEVELAKATEEYQAADEHLRQCLPPLIAAVFSLLPYLLATQIEIQNTMLANYYTVVHSYCEQYQFPSPAPPMDDIIAHWEHDLLPVQQEVESFGCLVNGKAVRMAAAPDTANQGLSTRFANGLNFRRPSSGQTSQSQSQSQNQSQSQGHSSRLPSPSPSPSACRDNHTNTSTTHSYTNHPLKQLPPAPTPSYDTKPLPVFETKPRPADFSPSSTPHSDTAHLPVRGSEYAHTPLSTLSASLSPASASALASTSAPSRSDYFSLAPSHQRPARSPTPAGSISRSTSPNPSAVVAAKKKPPPPPPKPRAASSHATFVTALYDFGGQSAGDLAFREGDRIRVLKKTQSTDDWWEGELHGVKGSFPANYVR